MKLLVDQNLSYRLVAEFEVEFPGSRHVRDLDLASSDDDSIWDHAKEHGFCIVSKDSDFHQKSFLLGQVWEAHDEELRRQVALKFVRPDQVDARSLERFEREARAGGRARRCSARHADCARIFRPPAAQAQSACASKRPPGSPRHPLGDGVVP